MPLTTALPYAHLNLFRNPFGELGPEERTALAVAEVDGYVRRLRWPGHAVQFTGRKGRGKTTHLWAILRHFPDGVYLHVGEDEQPAIPHGSPLVIDEIQRVTPWRRRRLFRRGVPLALGTHEDVAPELRRAGYDVETVALDGRLEAGRLWEMLNRRIDAARRGPGPLPRVKRETSRALMDRFGDDVRSIEWRLYEVFQDLSGVQDV